MTLTLDISDDLKPDEASELVNMAREQNRPIGMLILEAARTLVKVRREKQEKTEGVGAR